MKITLMPINKLELSESEQDSTRIRELTACIRRRGLAAIPPVAVVLTTDGADIWDGHHRVLAAKNAGLDAVPTVNRSAMRRADVSAYRRKVNRWRKQGCMKWKDSK